MANLLDKLIQDLLDSNGGEETPTVVALRAKRDELGDDVSEQEARDAALSVLMQFMPTDGSDDAGSSSSSSSDDDIQLTSKDIACMEATKAMIVEYLHDEEWHYSTSSLRKDVFIFEFGCTLKSVSLRIKIYVEGDPNVCRIVVYLPSADAIYAYPLCKLLAKENYSKRFGSFKYDERDGEVCYEYSVLTENGLTKDDFERYLNACLGSAANGYADIRRYCVGRFKRAEVDEILEKVNDLVNDINA